MIWIDRLGIVWACVVAVALAISLGGFRLDVAEVPGMFLPWAVFTVAPWALLRGLRWVVIGGRRP